MAGIYIHIPFCKTRCIYCDFYSTTRSELKQQYIRALCTELKTRKGYLKEEPIETINFDALIRRGHSIVIIEHNMDVIKCADYVIDLGPEGGDKGGNIVAVGTPEEVAACGASYTGQFLKEKLS